MEQNKPVVCIGGTASGVGKTSIAVGLMAALRDNGLTVQAFKVGPDFIDPMHHERATGRPSINLDGWMLNREQALATFHRHMADADVAVVEGVMGLFDGCDGASEVGSTAQMAKWLGAPVVLVLDCAAVARSAAAIVKGYQVFDPELRIGGLLFNKVGGAAHTKWLTEAVESAGLGVAVLGGIPKEEAVAVQERYLGLHLPQDGTMPPNLITNLATLVRSHVDLEALMSLAATARLPGAEAAAALPPAPVSPPQSPAKGAGMRDDTAQQEVEEERAQARNLGVSSGESAGPPEGEGQTKKQKRKQRRRKKKAADRVVDGSGDEDEPGEAEEEREAEAEADEQQANEQRPGPSPVAEGEAGLQQQQAEEAEPLRPPPPPRLQRPPVRIAVARDAAFCFYYHDNLTLLEEAGAELVSFSPLAEPLPPDVAGVYLGGGYPERHAAELADNKLLRAGLHAFADAGGVVYAECGGLLFLCRTLQPRGEPPQPMVGVFPFKAVMPPGKYTQGYVEVEATASCPIFPPGATARGHVHHCSEVVGEHHVGGVAGASRDGSSAAHGSGGGGLEWAAGYVARPQTPGASEAEEGYSAHSVLASFVHLHFGGCPELAAALVERCRGVDVAGVSAEVAASAKVAAMLEGSCVHATPPSLVQQTAGHTGMYAHRSSPDFHRAAMANGRSRSMDSLHRHLAPPPGAQLPKAHSPATTLGRVFSSTSLQSLHSGALHPEHSQPLLSWHHAERASHHSESPLQLSPRGGGSGGGGGSEAGYYYSHAGGADYAGSAELHGGHEPHHMARGNQLAVAISPGGRHYAHLQQQQQQQHGQYQQQHAQAAANGTSHFGENVVRGGLPWAQMMAAAVPHPQQQQQQQPGQGGCAPGASGHTPAPAPQGRPSEDLSTPFAAARLLPGPLDLSSLQRQDTGGVAFVASGSATPHNWQHSYPPSDKVVTLGPGATEIAWALGLGNRVVAVSDTCDYPLEAATRAKVARRLPLPEGSASGSVAGSLPPSISPSPIKGSSNSLVSLPSSAALAAGAAAAERAVAAAAAAAKVLRSGGKPAPLPCRVDDRVLARERPGLIVFEEEEAGSGGIDGSAVGRAVHEAVRAVGLQQACRVVCVRHATLADVLSSMITVGEAAGVAEEAARCVDRLRARLRRVAGEASRAGGRPPRVLLLSSLQPLATVGRWAPDVALLAGGADGLQDAGDPARALTWEQVRAYAPEVIVVAGLHRGGEGRVFRDLCAVAALPGWWLLPAVKSGSVFVCEGALLARAGPRLVDGVESLARMIHGDAVSVCCPPGAVLRLSLRPVQRCRPRLLPNYFMGYC